MKKKYIFIFVIIVTSYIIIQFYQVEHLKEDCITQQFKEKIEKNGLIEGKIYDFSQIINCKKWDKLVIVGGKHANRTIIFLKEGIALPKIDYRSRLSGSLLFYFIKDRKLISPPLEYWQQDFLYFKDFNDFDYMVINREKAKFKCVELDIVGPPEKILTFEKIK